RIDECVVFHLVRQQEIAAFAIRAHLMAVVHWMTRRIEFSPGGLHAVLHTVVTVNRSTVAREHVTSYEQAPYGERGAFLEQGSSFHIMGGVVRLIDRVQPFR